MRQVLKATAWIVGALLIMLIAAFAWGRLRPPTPAQAEALKLLQPSPMPAGRNAWPAFWLMDYDVPADRIDAVYAQERIYMQDWANDLWKSWASHPPSFASAADGVYKPRVATQYPKRPAFDTADHRRLCTSPKDDCLTKVRDGGQPLRDLLTRQAGRLAQVESINKADALWDDTPSSYFLWPQMPAFSHTEDLLLTATAVDFVDGRQVQTLTAICRQAIGVRRLHAHTNTLITAMITIGWMEADERVLAGMLRELPSDQPLPDDCMRAFAPPTQADVSLCMPMQREFDFVTDVGAPPLDPKTMGWFTRLRWRVLFDPQGRRRLLAPTFAWACQTDVLGAALADQPLPMTNMLAVHYDLFDAVSNAVGLILARIGAPAYTQYAARNQDYAASLRVMDWLLHARAVATTAAGWQKQLAKALPTLRESGNRSISIDPDGRFLRMSYYAPRADRTELVLPLMR